MRAWSDRNPHITKAQKKWYLFNPAAAEHDMIGFDKLDGQGSITLVPGDLIELTEIEVAANMHRSIMRDGTVTVIDEKKLKQMMNPTYNDVAENVDFSDDSNLEALLMLDDVDFLNKVANIKKKTFLRRIYQMIQDDKYKKLYSTIKRVKQYVDEAKVR